MKKSMLIACLLLLTITVYCQDTLLFNASYIPHTDTTLVFIPHHYNAGKSYPLIFMLHGYSGNYAQWNDITNLQEEANKDSFIIVCPDGFYNSWYVDSPVESNSQYVKFFFHDLVPAIFTKYKIDRSNIFITGLSMGGHGAMYLFLTHSNFFKSAGSTSGILDLMPFPNSWELKNKLGPQDKNKKIWLEHSDIDLLKNIKGSGREIIVDCGTEDFSFNVNKRFAEACKKDGVNIKFITGPGYHNHQYWVKSIPMHFRFFHRLVLKSKQN